ncbi:MAG TPA: PAS domain S-box protein [Steroidobacteraceae bacterium]|nr:PAS domain S-box protein [Steroidobacteraceae bacterium]
MPIDNRILELLVETVKDYAVFVLDPQGNVASWNTGARLLNGYRPDEIIGKHFSTFYTDEARQRGWPQHELRMATIEGRFEDEGWRIRKDGSRFWANVVITALRDDGGKLLGFSKITRDLTSRRQSEELLRQSEERFRLLVEGVADYAVYLLDPEGVITSWNAGAQRIKGYTRDEVIGKHVAHFYLPEDIDAGVPWKELAIARTQGHLESEGWRVRKDGGKFMARNVLSAFYDSEGRLQGFSKVTQDLSAREYAQSLERTTQHITEFIAIMAHELRNPLAPIRNAVSVMTQMRGDSGVQERMLQTIERQTTHLMRIVDDMLDVSRVTRGTLSISPRTVDLSEVIRNAVETVSPAIEQAQHRLTLALSTEPLYVHGDAERLIQVVVNLLTNAVRFTPSGGSIRISASSHNTYAVLSVADTGRGIAAEDIPLIFSMFIHGKEALHRVGGGLGVGLALSRRIAELHEGTIEARSAGPNKGSEFTLRLPRLVGATPPPLDKRAPLEAAGIAARRVLVVDDNEDAANTLEALLRSLGHTARVAYDGPTAIELADEFHPEVVLLDIGMSGMNGYDVARRLRHRTGTPIKIIAVTGWGTEEDRERSMEAGFDKHLVKPVDQAELAQELISNGFTAH